jgi:hypothetical protein
MSLCRESYERLGRIEFGPQGYILDFDIWRKDYLDYFRLALELILHVHFLKKKNRRTHDLHVL